MPRAEIIKRNPDRFIKDEEFDPEKIERTVDGLVKQINNMLSETANKSLQITVTDTDGIQQTITIEVNKYGIVKKADISN